MPIKCIVDQTQLVQLEHVVVNL